MRGILLFGNPWISELPMRLIVIRHTKVAVESGICYGQSDVAVADSFEEEKKQVLNRVQNVRFDKIYSSPLLHLLPVILKENRNLHLHRKPFQLCVGSVSYQWYFHYVLNYRKHNNH